MAVTTVVSGFFLFAGCFFMVVAAIGVVRLPDFFTRLHACGKADTLGQILIFFGLMIYEGFNLITIKMIFIVVFILVANPTATHAAAKAAFIRGLKPWRKGDGNTD